MKRSIASLADEYRVNEATLLRLAILEAQFTARTLGLIPFYSSEDAQQLKTIIARQARLSNVLRMAQRAWLRTNRAPGSCCPPAFPIGHPLSYDFS